LVGVSFLVGLRRSLVAHTVFLSLFIVGFFHFLLSLLEIAFILKYFSLNAFLIKKEKKENQRKGTIKNRV